ncbi:MAG: hypothetical protein DRP64_19040 [Verrucomicrobia bacterium]|nr:MAG: hypothetical protein DRP64_19040 [Verrucomicrobiota bacterium]
MVFGKAREELAAKHNAQRDGPKAGSNLWGFLLLQLMVDRLLIDGMFRTSLLTSEVSLSTNNQKQPPSRADRRHS